MMSFPRENAPFLSPAKKLSFHRWTVLIVLLAAAFLTGCATPQRQLALDRPFNFATDSFAFENELVWEYYFDEEGRWTNRRREPAADYTHHCFVVARAARQFFQHAHFEPDLPKASDKEYRQLIRTVVRQKPSTIPRSRFVIPGFSNLREFSAAKAKLLQEECGGAWRSYLQRGHWRMMLPFTKAQQKQMVERLKQRLDNNVPPIVHIVNFPSLSINHALLLTGYSDENGKTVFHAYDPNNNQRPIELTFEAEERSFYYPANDYFHGGRVDIYEIYHSPFY
jgi:hypothetical protein